ncbi:hypothetical protein CR513_49430, partial [Mucuna pruriens]
MPMTRNQASSMNEEELRIAHIKEYAAKARVARRYGQRVIHRDFKVRDLVLRKVTLRAKNNKLMPKWKGPFKIVESVGRGAYRLEHLDNRRIPRTWNAQNEGSWERNDLSKLQNQKRTAIKTDPGSKERKLQDPK